MQPALSTADEELVEQAVELARQEADIFVRLAGSRRSDQDNGEAPLDSHLVTSSHLVHWSREMAEAVICSAGGADRAGTASRVWRPS